MTCGVDPLPCNCDAHIRGPTVHPYIEEFEATLQRRLAEVRNASWSCALPDRCERNHPSAPASRHPARIGSGDAGSGSYQDQQMRGVHTSNECVVHQATFQSGDCVIGSPMSMVPPACRSRFARAACSSKTSMDTNVFEEAWRQKLRYDEEIVMYESDPALGDNAYDRWERSRHYAVRPRSHRSTAGESRSRR
jgi:hypothetical protein